MDNASTQSIAISSSNTSKSNQMNNQFDSVHRMKFRNFTFSYKQITFSLNLIVCPMWIRDSRFDNQIRLTRVRNSVDGFRELLILLEWIRITINVFCWKIKRKKWKQDDLNESKSRLSNSKRKNSPTSLMAQKTQFNRKYGSGGSPFTICTSCVQHESGNHHRRTWISQKNPAL